MIISGIENVSVSKDVDPSYLIVQVNEGKGQVNLSFSSPVQVLIYSIEGGCVSQSLALKGSVAIDAGHYNLLRLPSGDYTIRTAAAENTVIAVAIKADFVEKYLSPLYFQHENPSAFSMASSENLLIDLKSSSVLHDIVNCEFNNHLRGLYLKAKVIELFSLYLVQNTFSEKGRDFNLKTEDIEKIALVKKYIDEHPEAPVTIAQLAKQAGTNVQYLKTHFKLLNDTTVFNYIFVKRMEYAKNLLISGKYRIAEVAYKSGYKQPSHFSSSFKKHFGYLPQRLKSHVDGKSVDRFGIKEIASEETQIQDMN